MSFDVLRPIVVGILATLAVGATSRVLAKWIPTSVGDKSRETLLSENRIAIWTANCLVLVGLAVGVLMVKVFGYADNDWRPLALGFGIAMTAPLLVMVVAALAAGRSPAESIAAYAMNQKLPPAVLFTLAGLGLMLTVVGFRNL